MTYNLAIGVLHPLFVGPFQTAVAAQQWAEREGIDTWRLIEVEAPADAPAVLAELANVTDCFRTGHRSALTTTGGA